MCRGTTAGRSASGIGLRIRTFEASASPSYAVPRSPIHGHAGGDVVQDLLFAEKPVGLGAHVLQIEVHVVRQVEDAAAIDADLVLDVADLRLCLVVIRQKETRDA